ncbi:MAG TPA: hypothetical protein VMZ31_07730 [Phycisphaerae bacterium]|nr:hypothetical protein [Phycisphaerae bacterium]
MWFTDSQTEFGQLSVLWLESLNRFVIEPEELRGPLGDGLLPKN